MEMDTLTFNTVLRDAIVLRLRETEEGRDYLKDCWRYRQTEPDWDSIRKYQSEKTRLQEVTKC